ncbi:MAG: putative permease [Firmicutes bacterium]|nr:putative permease [Bacillota bacterium]
MESFYLVLTQLEVFTVMILLGIFAIKTKALNEIYLGDLSKLIMRLILPVMIFQKSINGTTRADMLFCFTEVILSTVLMYGVLFFTGFVLKRIFSLNGNYGRVFHASTMFGNVGFIGIPLILGILPERGMLYMALFTIVDMVMLWTIGFHLTLPEEKLEHSSLTANLKNIFNPAILSIFLAILFILMEWKLPVTLNKALGAVGDMTTPLSLIYIGGTFYFCNVGKFLTRIEYYAIIVVKMIAIPLLIFSILRFFNFQPEIIIFITTLTGMPSMAAIAMFARTNDSDEDCAVGAILITTIFCLVTLPLVAYLTGY